jgi:hypothetical protein
MVLVGDDQGRKRNVCPKITMILINNRYWLSASVKISLSEHIEASHQLGRHKFSKSLAEEEIDEE